MNSSAKQTGIGETDQITHHDLKVLVGLKNQTLEMLQLYLHQRELLQMRLVNGATLAAGIAASDLLEILLQ